MMQHFFKFLGLFENMIFPPVIDSELECKEDYTKKKKKSILQNILHSLENL